MRRLVAFAVGLAVLAPLLESAPAPAAAEPFFCVGMRKKAHLEPRELEAFMKHCGVTAVAKPPAGQTTSQPSGLNADALLSDSPLTAKKYVVSGNDLNSFKREVNGEVKVADARANTSAADAKASDAKVASANDTARSALDRRAVCQYKVNWLGFVAGLATLARAPKLRDSTQLLTFAAPLPFSGCEKPIDINVSPLVVPASIALVEGGAAMPIHPLEANYSGSFAVTPADAELVSIESVFDADKKVVRDQFTVKALKYDAKGTTLTVQDQNGTSKQIRVLIKQKPPV